jgi:hypothetical protein
MFKKLKNKGLKRKRESDDEKSDHEVSKRQKSSSINEGVREYSKVEEDIEEDIVHSESAKF